MISSGEPKPEMAQTPKPAPAPTPVPTSAPPVPTPEALATKQFEEIKEALIGPKLDDSNKDKDGKTWVLPKQDPKTNFSKP